MQQKVLNLLHCKMNTMPELGFGLPFSPGGGGGHFDDMRDCYQPRPCHPVFLSRANCGTMFVICETALN